MNQILTSLLQKVKQDRKILIFYSFLDIIFSFIVTLLNLLTIILATVALFRLINKIINIETSGTEHFYTNTTLVLILLLVIFIITQFFLTIFLEIYKSNMRYNHYLKIRNSVENLIVKHQNQKISEEEFEKCIDTLYKELNKKDKRIISKVVFDYLRTGGK